MPRSLVTGGAGFLGSHLVTHLVARGDPVRVLDLVDTSEPVEGVEYRIGSVTDRAVVRSAIQGVKRVFHLAGSAELWSPDPAEMYRVHLEGTRNVIEAGAQSGVERIVHTSTEAILRDFSPARGVPEGYCRAKAAAEREAFDAAERGIPVVVVSPAAPLGPGDRNLTPPSRMLLDFLEGRHPAYLDGWLTTVDVRDLAVGHRAAAELGEPGAHYLLVGETLRLGALLRRLEALTGRQMPRLRVPGPVARAVAAVSEFVADHRGGPPPGATRAGVRIALAPPPEGGCYPGFAELGLRPRGLDETLADAVGWFADEGLLKRGG